MVYPDQVFSKDWKTPVQESFKRKLQTLACNFITEESLLRTTSFTSERLLLKFVLKMQGVQQKSISNFEGQCPTFSFNRIHQKYTNIVPYECNFDNYRFFPQITFSEEIMYFITKG